MIICEIPKLHSFHLDYKLRTFITDFSSLITHPRNSLLVCQFHEFRLQTFLLVIEVI